MSDVFVAPSARMNNIVFLSLNLEPSTVRPGLLRVSALSRLSWFGRLTPNVGQQTLPVPQTHPGLDTFACGNRLCMGRFLWAASISRTFGLPVVILVMDWFWCVCGRLGRLRVPGVWLLRSTSWPGSRSREVAREEPESEGASLS